MTITYNQIHTVSSDIPNGFQISHNYTDTIKQYVVGSDWVNVTLVRFTVLILHFLLIPQINFLFIMLALIQILSICNVFDHISGQVAQLSQRERFLSRTFSYSHSRSFEIALEHIRLTIGLPL